MGSHSVTCHPTQMNAPRLTPAVQVGTWFTYPRGMEGWVDLVDLIVRSRTSDLSITSPTPNHCTWVPIEGEVWQREIYLQLWSKKCRLLCILWRKNYTGGQIPGPGGLFDHPVKNTGGVENLAGSSTCTLEAWSLANPWLQLGRAHDKRGSVSL